MRKVVSILLVLVLAFTCLALTGCGNRNNTADNNDPQGDPYIDEGEPGNEGSGEKETKDHQDTGNSKNNVEKDENGLYVYKLCNEAVEIHINTNVWDYIDGDNVWDATRMAADLGFTNPVLFKNHSLNGFQTSDKNLEVLIWNATDDIPNDYGLIMVDDFTITKGDNPDRPDSAKRITNTAGAIISYNEDKNDECFYQIAGSYRQETNPVGINFDRIVFTAAAMEVCNGTIDIDAINNALVIYEYPFSGQRWFLIP